MIYGSLSLSLAGSIRLAIRREGIEGVLHHPLRTRRARGGSLWNRRIAALVVPGAAVRVKSVGRIHRGPANSKKAFRRRTSMSENRTTILIRTACPMSPPIIPVQRGPLEALIL